MGNTLRISAGARERSPSKRSERAPAALDSKIRSLLSALPHLPDCDIARMLDTDSMHVAAVRQSLESRA
jgi:hypothetical protein